jgi:hypothetical protein
LNLNGEGADCGGAAGRLVAGNRSDENKLVGRVSAVNELEAAELIELYVAVTLKVPAVEVEMVKLAVPLDKAVAPKPVKLAAGPELSASVTLPEALVAMLP